MTPLKRCIEPAILKQNSAAWTAEYIEDVRKAEAAGRRAPRPSSSRYGHGEIRDALRAISAGKCFFCEKRLGDDETVEHYVDIAEDRGRAFEWENLYLCCTGCQRQRTEATVPRSDCLDPCRPRAHPRDHFVFHAERMTPRDMSSLGRSTIEKYQLNRVQLQGERIKELQNFRDLVEGIRISRTHHGRNMLTPQERDLIISRCDPSCAFSLMVYWEIVRSGLFDIQHSDEAL